MRPLAGAQVSIVGTGRGTLTNQQGQFLIPNVPAGSQTVRVQMIGYGAAEQGITVAEGATATVELQLSQSAIELDEVVVTGTAGASTKREIGNSVSTVSAAEVTEKAPLQTVQELLTARTPGLTLLSNSGQVGTASRIRIRGAGSLSGRLEPVIYVDGVRMFSGYAEGYSTGNGVVQSTSPLDAINPNDIESMEVIKGPAAATLYGADAAGGVIQIITKKGRASEGIQWTAQLEAGRTDWDLEKPTNYTLCTPSRMADTATFPGCQGVAPNTLLTDVPLERSYQCLYTENCQPNPLRTGDNLGFNVSARGGGENYNFFLSVENGSEEGVYFNNISERTGGRANLGFIPSEKLNFNVNVSYARNHVQMPLNNNSSNSILRNAFRGRPGFSAPWAEGFRGFSPEISNQYDNDTDTERTILGLTANYNPFSWLSNKLTLGLDKNDRVNEVFYTLDQTGRAPWGNIEATGAIYRFLPTTHTWTVDYAGTVSNDLTADIASDFSVGMQLNAYQFESHEAIGEGLVANQLNLVGAAAVTRGDQDLEEQNSLGFFVQEQIGWKNRLFVTGALRVDDNSAFGENFDRVYYPKASVSYVISEEPFFNVPTMDNLRLRAAWGKAGNAPEPFSADRTLAPTITTVGDVAVNQLAFDAYGNPNLQAETGQEIELGLDASFFNGRAGAELTYYNQHTKDALIAIPDPPSSGFADTHLINVGEIANRGIELLLRGTPIAMPNIGWETTLSVGTNDNELVSFAGARDEIAFGAFAVVQKHIEGYPLGGFWAQDVVRDEAGNVVLDESGNATVDFENETYVGPMLPTREIAFTNTVTLFNNLQLYANLDYKGGNYQWCAICSIRNRIDQNTFEVNDPNATPEQLALWTSRQTATHIVPADFIKLRELSATYSLPGSWSQRFGADVAALTLSGRNLFIWTDYDDRTGMADPEVVFDTSESFEALDYASTPMLRRLMLSLRVSF